MFQEQSDIHFPKQFNERFVFFGMQRGMHLCSDGVPCFPELTKLGFAQGGEFNDSGSGIVGMGFAANEGLFLQKDEHGSHGAGVGVHPSSQFALGDGVTSGEGCEQDELIRSDTESRELRIRPAMHGQVGSPKGHGQFALFVHSATGPRRIGRRFNSCVHARTSSLFEALRVGNEGLVSMARTDDGESSDGGGEEKGLLHAAEVAVVGACYTGSHEFGGWQGHGKKFPLGKKQEQAKTMERFGGQGTLRRHQKWANSASCSKVDVPIVGRVSWPVARRFGVPES